jgi:hypothetical protein
MSQVTPALEHVITVKATIDPLIDMGKTPEGQRRVVLISGGTFEGTAGLKGTIMPGGEDWQLIRDDGTMLLDARYWLRNDDGAIIRVHNSVLITPAAKSGDPAQRQYARSSVKLEAPVGKHDWLNQAIFVGTIEGDFKQRPATVTLQFYKVI